MRKNQKVLAVYTEPMGFRFATLFHPIHITARAEEDLNQAVNYIDHILLNPKLGR